MPKENSVQRRTRILNNARDGLSMFGESVVGFCDNTDNDFISLTILLGNYGDYLAIAKRFGPQGVPEVLFSNGATIVEALLNLNRGLLNGAWKADKVKEKGKKK